MKRKFEMVEKGFEYATEGYCIKKTFQREAVTHTGFSTLDRYKTVAKWNVCPDNERVIYTFHTLKDAKNFIINRDKEVLDDTL